MTKRVLNVGQCSMDHGSISRLLNQHFEVEIVRAHDEGDTLAALGKESFDLVLVNRKLDRNGADGVELIRKILDDKASGQVPCMLVSNYPEAQTTAVEAGAVPGFGKAALNLPQTIERLASALS